MDNRYEVIEWRGHKFDRMTIAAIKKAEALIGYELEIAQGSYNGTAVEQSAGTHAGGGAVDFVPGKLPKREVRCLRTVGFAAWLREPDEGEWEEHEHAILIGNDKAAPAAKRQIESYRAGRNGLKSNLPDPTWRPTPIPTFNYTEDEDMPYTDWPEADRKALVNDIVNGIFNRTLGATGYKFGPAIQAIGRKLAIWK